jgi:hypothetical protein
MQFFTSNLPKNLLMPRGIKLVDTFLDGLGVLLPTPVLCDIELLAERRPDSEVELTTDSEAHQKTLLFKNMGKIWGNYGKIYFHRDVKGEIL